MSPQCWFLTGSQGLYGPEIVEQVEGNAQQIVAALNDADELGVEVVWKPVLTDAGAIHRVMLEANSDPDCIGVIAWMHTFSPAKMWIAGLDALRTPLLHLHTQADAARLDGEGSGFAVHAAGVAERERHQAGPHESRVGLADALAESQLDHPPRIAGLTGSIRLHTLVCVVWVGVCAMQGRR